MPFLTYMDAASIDPADHVNREVPVKWLCNSMESFLCAPDKSRGRAMAVLGQRGMGKSILARKAIDELRLAYSATTLFVIVDCRHCRNQRAVYHAIATQIVTELGQRQGVDESMRATARLLETITTFDTIKESMVYERITRFKQAVKLNGSRNLLKLLGLGYDINLERDLKHAEKIEGSIHFDANRQREAVTALFRDLREHQGYDAIVVLDNLDELNHEAIIKDDERIELMAEIDALLGLALAPIGLVLTVRTYFASSLTRAIGGGNKILECMSLDDHVHIVETRLAREREKIQAQFTGPEYTACLRAVASLAPTPLALVKWFNYLSQNELHTDPDIATNLRGLARDQYATLPLELIEQVVAAFDAKLGSSLSEAELLAACANNRAYFKLLLRYQIVLPLDFWQPTDFTLTPDLHFMRAAARA